MGSGGGKSEGRPLVDYVSASAFIVLPALPARSPSKIFLPLTTCGSFESRSLNWPPGASSACGHRRLRSAGVRLSRRGQRDRVADHFVVIVVVVSEAGADGRGGAQRHGRRAQRGRVRRQSEQIHRHQRRRRGRCRRKRSQVGRDRSHRSLVLITVLSGHYITYIS